MKRTEIIEKAGIVTLGIIVVNIIIWIIGILAGGGSFFWLFISGGGYPKDLGELTYQTVMTKNEWWRLLTCGYLHVGVFHLVFNIFALLCVGSRMERRMGKVKYFFVYHIGTVCTAFLWCLIFRQSWMIGASLGIFVLFGMYLVDKKTDETPNEFWMTKREMSYFLQYAVISCVLGVPTIVVHGIGVCVGAAIGMGNLLIKKCLKRA